MSTKWTAIQVDGAAGRWRVDLAGREFEVTVDWRDGGALALERSVDEASGRRLPASGGSSRFAITTRTNSHGDLFELEEDTVWTILDDGQPIGEFTGGTSHRMEDGTWGPALNSSGCDFVILGADRLHVLAGTSTSVTCRSLVDLSIQFGGGAGLHPGEGK